MVIVPTKFIFLATPRTGSRAVAAALMQLDGAREHRQHHVHPEDIDTSAESLIEGSSSLPRCTIIRDPYTQTLSMFYHVIARHLDRRLDEHDFLRFIEEIYPGWWFADKLYPYREAADEVFLWEPDLQFVVQEVADFFNVFPCPTVLHISDSPAPVPTLLSEKTRAAIERRFPKDVGYYYSLLE